MSGAVSEEVWRKIRVQFDSLDKNRDGKITVKEVEEVLAAQNLDYSPQKIRVLIEKADTNRDGLVNWNEFLALMTSEMKVNNTGHLNLEDNEPVDVTEILRAFKMFDDDNNGTIDITEFKKAMRELEIGDTDQKLEKLFFELDVNSDGQIDATEFVALFKKE